MLIIVIFTCLSMFKNSQNRSFNVSLNLLWIFFTEIFSCIRKTTYLQEHIKICILITSLYWSHHSIIIWKISLNYRLLLYSLSTKMCKINRQRIELRHLIFWGIPSWKSQSSFIFYIAKIMHISVCNLIALRISM